MKLTDIYSPKVTALTDQEFASLKWEGPMAHVGPVHTLTPLQEALSNQLNCAHYLLMVGTINLIRKLTENVFSHRLNEYCMEFIYLYQFDWRFPKYWHTTETFISEMPDKRQSVAESVPFYFFLLLYSVDSPFYPGSPATQTSFLMNFTRHLAGPKRKPVIDDWFKKIIERLDTVAPYSGLKTLSLLDFPDRHSHLDALRHVHGTPLSPKTLDPGVPLNEIDHRRDAIAIYDSVDFAENPLLRPVQEFDAYESATAPFYSTKKDW